MQSSGPRSSSIQPVPGLLTRSSGLPWALVAVAFWGTSSLVIVFLGDVPAGALLLATHAIGAAALSVLAVARHSPTRTPSIRITPRFVGVALLGTLVYQTCYVNGLRLAPAGEANLLNYLWPTFTAALAVPLRGEHLSKRVSVALLAGLAGSAVLVGGLAAGEYPQRYLGYTLAFGGAVAWGAYSNLIARLPGSAVDHQRCILVIGALAFLPVAALEGFGSLGLHDVAGVAFLGIGSVALAAVCWQSAMARGPVGLVASAAYVTPLLSTLMLVVLAGQPADWRLGAGLLLVLIAGVLSSRS